jgi:SAM-dependent methyltransferase
MHNPEIGMDELTKTAAHWSESSARSHDRYLGVSWWEAGPGIQAYINRRISGEPETDWISYTLEKYFRNDQFPSTCHLSLGCGSGRLERTIVQKKPLQRFDAYDIAEGSIQIAKAEAAALGLSNIRYAVADVNNIDLPANTYDAVWVHSAMHHLAELENVYTQISGTLKPHGLLIMQEYIGPDRFQFPLRQREIANLCLQLLPLAYRTMVPEAVNLEIERVAAGRGVKWFLSKAVDKMRDRDFLGAVRRQLAVRKAAALRKTLQKDQVYFPTVRSVTSIDPSEAIRSSEIVTVLQRNFEILEKKDWGGNILQFLLAGIAGNFAGGDPRSTMLLEMLITIEETLLECGEYTSDYAYIVARPLS